MLYEKKMGFEKEINVSDRGYPIIYIDKCKVYTRNKTLVYANAEESIEKIFNIPYLNTSIIMLGVGTSITNEAIRLAAENSIIIMFVNNTYKVSATTDESFNILLPKSEYKINDYTHKIATIFLNDNLRLEKAKELLIKRTLITEEFYLLLKNEINIPIDEYLLIKKNFLEKIKNKNSITELLSEEANYTKKIYSSFSKLYNLQFIRDHEYYKKQKSKQDEINNYLTTSNYMFYALASSSLTVLNIPFSFAFLHGKTRRGALVFDIADLFKDALSIPLSFYFAKNEYSEKEFRKFLLENINKFNIYQKNFKEIMELLK